MSDTELRIGKVKEIHLDGDLTFEGKIDKLKNLGFNIKNFDQEDNYVSCDKLCIVDNRFFEILEDEDLDKSYLSRAKRNDDGTISYILKFYNGGTCFEEMIEEAILEMEKKDPCK